MGGAQPPMTFFSLAGAKPIGLLPLADQGRELRGRIQDRPSGAGRSRCQPGRAWVRVSRWGSRKWD